MSTWYFEADCSLNDLKAVIQKGARDSSATIHANTVDNKIPVYDCGYLRSKIGADDYRSEVMAEWSDTLSNGPGIIVLRGCFADPHVMNRARITFETLFGKPNNARIWNALDVLSSRDPALFVRYYANVLIAVLCESWVGPNYQVASQIDLIPANSDGQERPRRATHPGLQHSEEASYYPAPMHHAAQSLMLEGIIAHDDIDDMGPLRFLPFSQSYQHGYVAINLPDFQEFFTQNAISLPLKKGDAVFFNPAVYHSNAANETADNLQFNHLQISSAFSRTMEKVNRIGLCEKIYPSLLSAWQRRDISREEVVAAATVCADGYPFQRNLWQTSNIGPKKPKSQLELLLNGLERGLKRESFLRELTAAEASKPGEL